MSGKAAVRVRDLSKRFGAVVAVDRISLEVHPGEIFGLVGPDGAGKTTTLRLLCGLLLPDSGEIQIGGVDVARHPGLVRDKIGYMAQRFGLYLDLTVAENLDFYADLFGVDRRMRGQLLPQLMAMTRMEPFRNRRAGQLSGGMRQKLALMCTLIHRPEVLILDEPTCGVDPVSRRDFWEILKSLAAEGMAVLLTTAYLDEAERCDRVGLIYRGRLIQCAPPGQLKSGLQERCYRLQCRDERAAKPVLEKVEGVASAEPFGAWLHLFLDEERIGPGAISSLLEEHGLGPVTIDPIDPTLEDVFILLIRKAGRG